MNRFWSHSVKEAFDHLPSGVCFFDKNGTVTLCNYQMYRVFFALTGTDLQSLPELQELLACGSDIFLLDDGRAWRFAQEQITTQDGTAYTQVTASDVTELYRRQKELEEDNIKSSEFTEAEVRVLHLMVEGMTYKEMAEELGVTTDCVKKHISSMLSKTGYPSKTKLTAMVVSKRLIVNDF